MAKKNTTILQRIETLLDSGPMNAHQIIDEYKQRWPKTTPSMRQLSNLLSRHKQFAVKGESMMTNDHHIHNSYKINVWEIQERMV